MFALIPRFGGDPDPHVHPGVLMAVLAASALILLLPRKHVIVPVLAATLLIPFDQAVLIGPLHWTMLRIIVLVGWVRVLAGGPAPQQRFLSFRLNAIDKALLAWAGIAAVSIVLMWQTSAAFINQLGVLYNVFGIYFLARFLIRDQEDAGRAIRTLTSIGIVVAAIMLLEQASGQKVYAALHAGIPRQGRHFGSG